MRRVAAAHSLVLGHGEDVPAGSLNHATLPAGLFQIQARLHHAEVPHGCTPVSRIPHVDEAECVGCNLCSLVCPVDGCITMKRVDEGVPPETWVQRTSKVEAV